MRAFKLDEFLASLDTKVRQRNTVDGFKWGSPDAEVTGVAVSWMSTQGVIDRAIALGCNFVLTHEPTFYIHEDTDAFRDTPAGRHKINVLRANDMVVYRMHDAWDLYPGYGIIDRWLAHLGLQTPTEPCYPAIVSVEPRPVGALAHWLKAKMELDSVLVRGDAERRVSKIALACGAGGFRPLLAAQEKGADCYVAGEVSEWQLMRYAEDADMPVIVVGHEASERYGMMGMADFLRETFPGLKVVYVGAGSSYSVL